MRFTSRPAFLARFRRAPAEIIPFDRMSETATLEESELVFGSIRAIMEGNGIELASADAATLRTDWLDEQRIQGAKIQVASNYVGAEVRHFLAMRTMNCPSGIDPNTAPAAVLITQMQGGGALTETARFSHSAANGELVVMHNYLAHAYGAEPIPILPEHELAAFSGMSLPLTQEALTDLIINSGTPRSE